MRKSFVMALCLVASLTQAATISKPEVTLDVPAGWVEVPGDVLQSFYAEMKRQAPLAQVPKYDYAFQSTSGPPWLQYPYLLVKITPAGRPTERELTELPALDFNEKFQEQSGDWSKVMKDTTLGRMQYDKAANVVWMTSKSDVVNVGEVRGLSGFIPTEKGFVELHAYARGADFPQHAATFEKIITGAKVAPELKYAPSWADALPGPVSRIDFKQVGFFAAIGALIAIFLGIYRRRKA